jgi:hypothetical protein
MLNAFLGITAIRLRDYTLGGLGMIPGQVVRLFVGTTLSELTKDSMSFSSIFKDSKNNGFYIFVGICALLIFIGGLIYLTRVTKHYLRSLEEQADIETLEQPHNPLLPSQTQETPLLPYNKSQEVAVELQAYTTALGPINHQLNPRDPKI